MRVTRSKKFDKNVLAEILAAEICTRDSDSVLCHRLVCVRRFRENLPELFSRILESFDPRSVAMDPPIREVLINSSIRCLEILFHSNCGSTHTENYQITLAPSRSFGTRSPSPTWPWPLRRKTAGGIPWTHPRTCCRSRPRSTC